MLGLRWPAAGKGQGGPTRTNDMGVVAKMTGAGKDPFGWWLKHGVGLTDMRINTGNFGNVVAGPERAVNVGAPIGEGVRDIGAVLRRQELEAEAEAKRAQEQAMAEARANRRAADQAQATAKINLAADRLRDVAIELDDGVQTGSIGKDAVHTEWEARSKKVLDEAMADMPDSFKPLAAPALDSRRQMMRSDVDKIVRKRDQSDTLSGINQTLSMPSACTRPTRPPPKSWPPTP